MSDTCRRCGRPLPEWRDFAGRGRHGIGKCQAAVGIYYVHQGYGCDTGCCGHVFYLEGEHGDSEPIGDFKFSHDEEELNGTLAELAAKHGVPILSARVEFVDD